MDSFPLSSAVAYPSPLLKKKLFRLPKNYKNDTECSGVPFIQQPPMIISYITIVNDQNQAIDIGYNIRN